MIRSMTGFGRGNSESEDRDFIVEIKAVNHRYLELNIRMPRSLISLEDKIRKLVSEKIKRGKVDVFVTQNIYENDNVEVFLNEDLADSYMKCLKKIKDKYDVRDDISVTNIARFPDVIFTKQKEEDIEGIWNQLEKAVLKSIEVLITMREKEGLKLQQDINNKCTYIKEQLDKVEKKSPIVVMEYKEKLSQRLKDLVKDTQYDENRVAMEVAIFADKVGIDEEIVRLNSHIAQMHESINLHDTVGRKLDFIVQEMNREVNTIASKANDLEIINLVLNIKSEIEKIREQIQNIE